MGSSRWQYFSGSTAICASCRRSASSGTVFHLLRRPQNPIRHRAAPAARDLGPATRYPAIRAMPESEPLVEPIGPFRTSGRGVLRWRRLILVEIELDLGAVRVVEE